MPARTAYKWTFRARLRRHAFGWRSQPAIKRIKKAVSEIKKVARKDPVTGAEGAVLLLGKLSPALEQVDSSSGAIGTAVNNAIDANQGATYLATFRAIAHKYPHKDVGHILRDLVASTPGDEGKWFAAAKSAGLYREAIELANRTPCDPKTLTKAARDMAATEPQFALEAGMTALRWLVAGYGYEITSVDVREAYQFFGNGRRPA
jgi:hypothetical protein